jgi:hypothetical protein
MLKYLSMIFSDKHLQGFPECPHYEGRKVALEDVRHFIHKIIDFITQKRYIADKGFKKRKDKRNISVCKRI